MEINGTIINADLISIITVLKAELNANGINLIAKYFDSGDDVMLCCPYHREGQERRPSAGIRKSDGVFHCLACGETHELPEVISHCFGINDPFGRYGYRWLTKNFLNTIVEEREEIALDFNRDNGNSRNNRSSEDNRGNIEDKVLDSYRYTHPYLYERGLTDEVIDLFDIGYDKATDSITFPVRYWGSINFGNCLFIARRKIKYKQFDLPKNIEKPLYGLYEFWSYVMTNSDLTKIDYDVYIVEGLFDCLRLWSVGKIAVAGFGCLFSEYQIELLRGIPCRSFILATDNDEAGLKAREVLKLKIRNKVIYEAVLPEGRKDIGECTDDELINMEIVL